MIFRHRHLPFAARALGTAALLALLGCGEGEPLLARSQELAGASATPSGAPEIWLAGVDQRDGFVYVTHFPFPAWATANWSLLSSPTGYIQKAKSVSLAASGTDILVAVRDPNDKLKYIVIDTQSSYGYTLTEWRELDSTIALAGPPEVVSNAASVYGIYYKQQGTQNKVFYRQSNFGCPACNYTSWWSRKEVTQLSWSYQPGPTVTLSSSNLGAAFVKRSSDDTLWRSKHGVSTWGNWNAMGVSQIAGKPEVAPRWPYQSGLQNDIAYVVFRSKATASLGAPHLWWGFDTENSGRLARLRDGSAASGATVAYYHESDTSQYLAVFVDGVDAAHTCYAGKVPLDNLGYPKDFSDPLANISATQVWGTIGGIQLAGAPEATVVP